jgi:hypothetical protein
MWISVSNARGNPIHTVFAVSTPGSDGFKFMRAESVREGGKMGLPTKAEDEAISKTYSS